MLNEENTIDYLFLPLQEKGQVSQEGVSQNILPLQDNALVLNNQMIQERGFSTVKKMRAKRNLKKNNQDTACVNAESADMRLSADCVHKRARPGGRPSAVKAPQESAQVESMSESGQAEGTQESVQAGTTQAESVAERARESAQVESSCVNAESADMRLSADCVHKRARPGGRPSVVKAPQESVQPSAQAESVAERTQESARAERAQESVRVESVSESVPQSVQAGTTQAKTTQAGTVSERAPQSVQPSPQVQPSTQAESGELSGLDERDTALSVDETAQKRYTVWASFQELSSIQQLALAQQPKPDFTAALKSEELKGKLFGLYSDKSDKADKGDKSLKSLPKVVVEFV